MYAFVLRKKTYELKEQEISLIEMSPSGYLS